MLIGIALVTTTAIGSIALYKSYAIYKEEKNYNVIQGIIPDFDYDVKVALTVDGEEKEQVPGRADKDSEGNYYRAEVDCHDGDEKVLGASWDYNAWNLKLENVTSSTKCNLEFTSDLKDEEYKKYIEEGVEHRRNTYRGKELQADNTFYTSIEQGTFDDIYVGDYIKTTNNLKDVYNQDVIWLIADIDNYLYTGDQTTGLTKHHVTVIPATPIGEKQAMNKIATTKGGYAGSDMVKIASNDNQGTALTKDNGLGTGTLDNILTKYITCVNCVFKDHVIEYKNYLTTKVDENLSNKRGDSTKLGASSYTGWYPRKLDLMSEANVFGITSLSSAWIDTGIDHQQYAIFRLKPELINSYDGKRFADNYNYWLKDVASKNEFVAVDDIGSPAPFTATTPEGIRPRFLVGGTEQN